MNAFLMRRCAGLIAGFSILLISGFSPSTFAAPAPAKPAEPSPALSPASAVLIVELPEGLGAAESELLLQRRINTHIVTLRSEQNLRKMISNPNSEARKTKWFTEAENPRERATWLRDHLHVAQVSGTPLIEVSLSDVPDLAERRTILREVCETYLAMAKADQMDQLGDRTYALNTVKTKIEARMKQVTDTLQKKQVQLNLDGGGMGKQGMKEMELSKLVSELVDAQLRAEKLKGAFETVYRAVQQGQMPPGVDEAVLANVRIQELQRKLDDAELRLEIAQSRSSEKDGKAKDPLTKESPSGDVAGKDSALSDLKTEVTYLQKKVSTLSSEVAARAKVSYLEQSQQRASEAEGNRAGLAVRAEALKQELGDLNNMRILFAAMEDEQKDLRAQLKSVKLQIDQVAMLQSSTMVGGIRWHMQPEAEGN